MYPIFFRLPSWLPFMGGEPITSFGVFMFLSFLTGGILLRSRDGAGRATILSGRGISYSWRCLEA